jgi:hypothetical protein
MSEPVQQVRGVVLCLAALLLVAPLGVGILLLRGGSSALACSIEVKDFEASREVSPLRGDATLGPLYPHTVVSIRLRPKGVPWPSSVHVRGYQVKGGTAWPWQIEPTDVDGTLLWQGRTEDLFPHGVGPVQLVLYVGGPGPLPPSVPLPAALLPAPLPFFGRCEQGLVLLPPAR